MGSISQGTEILQAAQAKENLKSNAYLISESDPDATQTLALVNTQKHLSNK